MLDFLARDRRADDRRADEDRQAVDARSARSAFDELTRALGLDADQVIPFSADTGVGRDELAAAIVALMEPADA